LGQNQLNSELSFPKISFGIVSPCEAKSQLNIALGRCYGKSIRIPRSIRAYLSNAENEANDIVELAR
jgi:hypothetical protein